MRLHPELVVGGALVVALGIGAAALGTGHARVADVDRRRSTFLSGPSGSLGYGQALERLGVRVERFRRPPAELNRLLEDSTRTLVAVLGPTHELTVRDASALIATPTDLLLAGKSTNAALQCLGYRRLEVRSDTARMRGVLVTLSARRAIDSSEAEDGATATCTGPAPATVDTLLRVRGDNPAALRLTYQNGRTVTLVADDELFTNRALRTTEAGPFALGLVVSRYDRVIVDEYHHGFVTSGSLAGALLSWSARSPWGWMAWQLAIVGLLALLASAVRFGPVRSVIDRRRRSSLEHVRALATALAAAHGHAVAVGLIVRGLRRRLSRAGQPARDDPRAWLDGLADVVRTAGGRHALETLRELTDRPVGTDDVRRAANAVEDVWEELTTKPPVTPLRTTPLPPLRS